MTTQQDSVVVERLRAAITDAIGKADAAFSYSFNLTRLVDGEEANTLTMPGHDPLEFDDRDEGYALIAECRNRARADAVLAALSLPITQRDDQAKTYADGVEDAARYVEGHGGVIPGATAFIPMVTGDRMPCMSGDGRDRLMPARRREFDDATRSLATAIRRLSIEQGDQDGGAPNL